MKAYAHLLNYSDSIFLNTFRKEVSLMPGKIIEKTYPHAH